MFFNALSLFRALTKVVVSRPHVSIPVIFSSKSNHLSIAVLLWSDFSHFQHFVPSHLEALCHLALLDSVFSVLLLFSGVCVSHRSVCSVFCVLATSVLFLSVSPMPGALGPVHFSCLSCIPVLFLLFCVTMCSSFRGSLHTSVFLLFLSNRPLPPNAGGFVVSLCGVLSLHLSVFFPPLL